MNGKIFCLVLNYRHYLDTEKCIKRLMAADMPAGTRFIIVDNSPDLVSEKYLRRVLPKIKLIRNPRNYGFAKGNNIGIRYALKNGASDLLIINPDVTVGKIFFRRLIFDLNSDKRAGIIAPAIRHEQNGEIFFGLQGKVDWKTGKATHINVRKLTKETRTIEVEFVTFACALIKAEVFRKVGLLDERYFMYLEDVDYCLQAAEAGYKVLLNPSVIVDHKTSSSFARPTGKLPISFVSEMKFINKWLTFSQKVRPVLSTLLLYPYLYLLWTYQECKKVFSQNRGNGG